MGGDIRSFFKPQATGTKRVSAGGAESESPAAKKSRTSADATTSGSKGTPVRSPSKAAGKTKAAASGSSGTAPASAGSARKSSGQKRPIVLDSDDEASDEEKPKKGGEADEDDGGIQIDLADSSDEDTAPAAKKLVLKAPSAKAPAKASGKSAKASRPQMIVTPHSPKPAKPSGASADVTPAKPSGGRVMPGSMSKAAAKVEPEAEEDTEATKPAKKPAAKRAPAKRSTPRKPKEKKDPYADLSEVARAAVSAVDGVAQKLPPEEELGITIFESDGAAGFGARPPDEPAHPDSKDVPRGHPDCLTNKTFVLTGVGDSMSRPQTDDFIKRHGGRLTGSVSGKTSFLVAGTGCGKSKIAAAREKGTKIINEDGLLAMVKATVDLAPSVEQQTVAATAAAPSQPTPMAVAAAEPDYRSSKPAPPPRASKTEGFKASAPAAASPGQGGGELWVQKHRPQHSRELVGNGTLVQTLRQWLQNWEQVNLKGQAPEKSKAQGGKKDMSKKAVLLSGPPGIGKTSSAMIVTRELGFVPIEVNASDTRNKSDNKVKGGIGGKLSNAVKEVATNTALAGADGKAKKTVLIMDEVDGMSAGDRGGVADLIQTIAKAKIPIIAICNDKYHQKLKSLRNHCLELEYRRPTAVQIGNRMAHIARQEGLAINDATMRGLVESAHGDLRLVLGQMQMIRIGAATLAFDDLKKQSSKDADMSPFEAARKLLDDSSRHLSISDRSDLVFQDMDLVPLLLQENYVNHRPSTVGNELQQMQMVAKAADALSVGDQVTRRVRQHQHWSLMPFAAVIGSVYPATYMRGYRQPFGIYPGESNFPRFSAWFGANSSAGKQRRLLGEMHTRLAASGHFASDRSTLRLQYAPALRQTLTKPLTADGDAGIPTIIQEMHEYCMSRDDLDTLLGVTNFKTKGAWNEDPMRGLPTALKSAFTRNFNQQKVAPRTNIMVEEFKRRGARGAGKKLPIGGGGRKTGAASAANPDGVLRESEEEAAEAAAAAAVEEEEPEDEEEEEADLQQRLAGGGLNFKAAAGSGKGRGGRGSGRGRGRGSGAARGSGRDGGRGRK